MAAYPSQPHPAVADLPSNWSEWFVSLSPSTVENLSAWVKSHRTDDCRPNVRDWPGWPSQAINPFAISVTLDALRRQEELAGRGAIQTTAGSIARDHSALIEVQSIISKHMHETSIIYAAAICDRRFAADMTLAQVLGAILAANRSTAPTLHQEALRQLTVAHFKPAAKLVGKIVAFRSGQPRHATKGAADVVTGPSPPG